jgi:synaptic vesicle membrane protein VAT-1
VGDKGIDLVVDSAGGPTWSTGYDLLAPCGRLVACGVSNIASGKTRSIVHVLTTLARVRRWSPLRLMDDNKTVTGINMGHLFNRLDLLRPQFADLMALFNQGQIAPHVDRTFRFEEAAQAHHYLHDRKAIGKILLVP